MSTRQRVGPHWRATVVRAGLLLAAYSLAATFALTEFLRWPGVNSGRPDLFGRDLFGDMVYGRAPKPYVTRVLVPWLVRAAEALTPPAARPRFEESVRRSLTNEGKPEWLSRFPSEFVIAKYLLLLFTIGFAFALRWLAHLTLDVSEPTADSVPVAALLALPGLYGYGSMLYDLPALCLFTLGLALTAARRYWLYGLVFALSVLNKETGLLLTLVWAVSETHRRRLSRKHVVAGTILQVAAWGLIRGGLALAFRDNPGEMVALHLFRNLAVLARPANYFHFRAVGDWLVYPVGLNVVTLGLFAWGFVAAARRPGLLRDASLLVPVMVILSLLFGNIDELRVYYEAYPVLLTGFVGSLYRLAGYLPDGSLRRPAS